jgi:uncharacterized protein YecT (DUF1311 family)
MSQFRTLEFVNTPRGQMEKNLALENVTKTGWRVVSEVIIPGKFKGGEACCLFMICAPLAFLAGRTHDIISVTLEKSDDGPSDTSQGTIKYDRQKWTALLLYDTEVAGIASEISPLGPRWTDEFAAAYLTLNDPKYLPEIAARVREKALAEQAAEEERERKARALAEEQARQEVARKAETERRRSEIYQRIKEVVAGSPVRILITVGIGLAMVIAITMLVGRIATALSSPSASEPDGVLSTSGSSGAVTPSFDCARVVSRNLKLVCESPLLSQDDNQLASAYKGALRAAADSKQVRADERAWIVQRNRAQGDVQVLHQLYLARIAALNALAKSASVDASSSTLSAETPSRFRLPRWT